MIITKGEDGYWKEDALDGSLWSTLFWRGNGSVERHCGMNDTDAYSSPVKHVAPTYMQNCQLFRVLNMNLSRAKRGTWIGRSAMQFCQYLVLELRNWAKYVCKKIRCCPQTVPVHKVATNTLAADRMQRTVRSVQHEVFAWYGRRVLRWLVTTCHCAVYQKTWRIESSTDVRTPNLGTSEGCNCDVCTPNSILFAEEVAVWAVPSADVMNASHLNTFSSFLSLLSFLFWTFCDSSNR